MVSNDNGVCIVRAGFFFFAGPRQYDRDIQVAEVRDIDEEVRARRETETGTRDKANDNRQADAKAKFEIFHEDGSCEDRGESSSDRQS